MSLTRRSFIETASLTILASATLPAGLAQAIPGLRNPNPIRPQDLTLLDGISAETFKPFIGESFAIMQAGQKIGSLTLLSVISTAPASSAPKAQTAAAATKPIGRALNSFAMQFKGSGTPLPQDTYTLNHENLGSFALLLVPAGPGVNPQTYTSVFTFFAD